MEKLQEAALESGRQDINSVDKKPTEWKLVATDNTNAPNSIQGEEPTESDVPDDVESPQSSDIIDPNLDDPAVTSENTKEPDSVAEQQPTEDSIPATDSQDSMVSVLTRQIIQLKDCVAQNLVDLWLAACTFSLYLLDSISHGASSCVHQIHSTHRFLLDVVAEGSEFACIWDHIKAVFVLAIMVLCHTGIYMLFAQVPSLVLDTFSGMDASFQAGIVCLTLGMAIIFKTSVIFWTVVSMAVFFYYWSGHVVKTTPKLKTK